MDRTHWAEIGEMLGVELTGGVAPDDGRRTIPIGDRMLFVEQLARNRQQSIDRVYNDQSIVDADFPFVQLKQFSDAVGHYKTDLMLVDFTDMLEMFLDECGPIPVDVAIVDESQDLNSLQWAVARLALANASVIYIGGDDDQSIYKWAGANVDEFLNLSTFDRETLPRSYRLPRRIFEFAREIIGRVDRRFPKQWEPRPDGAEGDVDFVREISELDLTSGTWLLLARNTIFLKQWERLAEKQGVAYITRRGPSVDPDDARAIVGYEKRLRRGEPISGRDAVAVYERMNRETSFIDPDKRYFPADLGFSDAGIWHIALTGIPLRRREYYVSILRRGGNILKPPDVRIETIHAAKGGESDNVAVFTDMTRRTFDEYWRNPDDENRVFYVGFTRARERLFVVKPRTNRGFNV